MSFPFFSIVIPVYNREWCVRRAVASAVAFIGGSSECEIVLIDDGSTDESYQEIRRAVKEYSVTTTITFRIGSHAKNKGVCAAKNTGARLAHGTWLVFFDSDDELMPDGLRLLSQSLAKSEEVTLHFFIAIEESAAFDALTEDRSVRLDLKHYLANGSGGEALPVIKRAAFLEFPYDEDIRGYESLAYMRLVKNYGELTIHSLGLRRYYISHADRLSSMKGLRSRSNDLCVGHLRALREHYAHASILWSVKQIARAAFALVR